MKPRATTLFCLGIALTLGGCQPTDHGKPQPRVVLLYATCSLARTMLSPYNPSTPLTPNLQRFAEAGLVFDRHQTESGQSGTAFAALFSGTHAPTHGVYAHPTRLEDDVELIAEHFAAAGYETHSWLAHPMANAPLNYAQGIAQPNRHFGLYGTVGGPLEKILDRVAADDSVSVFLVTGFTVTHGPYGKWGSGMCERYPSRCEGKGSKDFDRLYELYKLHHRDFSWDFPGTARRLGLSLQEQQELERIVAMAYETGVVKLDDVFGQTIAAIDKRGLLDQSVIVFTADHGEIFVRDNAAFRWTHGMQLAPEVLTVPMIVRAPGQGVEPGRYSQVSRSIDVLPTLLGLAGLPRSENVEGDDLAEELRNPHSRRNRVALSHTAMLPEFFRLRHLKQYPALVERFPRGEAANLWVAYRAGDLWFELRGGSDEGPFAFDIAQDPGKRRSVFDAENSHHQAAETRMRAYRNELTRGFTRTREGAKVSDEAAEERLRALGYIQ